MTDTSKAGTEPELYPYSAHDAIKPNSPLPSSLMQPPRAVASFTASTPSTPSTAPAAVSAAASLSSPPAHEPSSSSPHWQSDPLLTSTSSLLQTLVELAIDVKRMAVEDGGKTVGTVELSQRMDELRQTLADHTDLIFSHHSSAHIHAALLSLRTVLLSCHLILRKALAVNWRRSARFKQPVRISINDVVVGLAKLGNAISLAVATASSSSSASPASTALSSSLSALTLQDGQEESLLADKHYFGHGLPVDHVKALQLYTAAAEKGYRDAMLSLACMLREGKGGRRKDLLSAVQWYKRAMQAGSAEAANSLGQLYEAGEGVQRSLESAIEHYQQAAEGGSLDAMTNLGYIYEHGSEDDSAFVPVDLDAAAAWYREAAEQGFAKAMNNLGFLHYVGATGGKSDAAEAVRWFTAAAEQGNAGAMNNLGICYESGKGVERDEEAALMHYLDAAAAGHVSAQSSLGYLYLKQRRFDIALEWLRKAADGGDREADYHLAQMFHHGLHVQRDDLQAFALYSRAAELGHPYALLELGHSLFAGRGCKKDVERAFAFYRQAAQLGVSEAENSVGVMMEEGVGSMRDLKAARGWYEKAAQRGNADAMFNLGLMDDSGLGADERNEKAAIDWFKKAAAAGSQQALKRLEQEEVRTRAKANS